MAFEELRARLERLLAEQSRRQGTRAEAEGLYQALLDTKVAVGEMRDALRATERELAGERQHLADAERRGGLADQIGDRDTADLARIWTGKHRERVALLERKQQVQEDELRMAERQLEELGSAYRNARAGIPPGSGSPPPVNDLEIDHAGPRLDRQAKEALVQEQLEALKRKMGK